MRANTRLVGIGGVLRSRECGSTALSGTREYSWGRLTRCGLIKALRRRIVVRFDMTCGLAIANPTWSVLCRADTILPRRALWMIRFKA
jgi:hypothetical protein